MTSALLARQRAVVGAGELAARRPAARLGLCAGQLVEAQREPLGGAPGVDEDERRAVRAHQLEQLAGRSPARSSAAGSAPGDWRRARAARRARPCLDRHHDRRSSALRAPASTIVQSRAAARRGSGRPPSSGRCVADRPMRCTARPGRARQPLERDARGARRAWSAPRRGSRRRSPLRRRAARAPRGEHEVQRLGRGDEDVGRRAQHRAALALRRVAGAHRRRCTSAPMPRSGARRFCSMS